MFVFLHYQETLKCMKSIIAISFAISFCPEIEEAGCKIILMYPHGGLRNRDGGWGRWIRVIIFRLCFKDLQDLKSK